MSIAADIIEDYTKGDSVPAIAARYGRNEQFIYRALRAAGATMRPRGRAPLALAKQRARIYKQRARKQAARSGELTRAEAGEVRRAIAANPALKGRKWRGGMTP